MPVNNYDRTKMPNDMQALISELWQMMDEAIDMLTNIKTQFEAHTHNGNGAQAGSYFTSPPRTDAATVTAGTARTITVAAPTKMTF